MSNHPLAADVHAGSLGQEIELFMVDYTMLYNRRTGLPGSVIYFCSSANNATAVQWKNKAGDALVAYAPLPVVAEGFESKSDGTLPRPKISVSNVEATLGVMAGPLFSLVYDYHDLLGAKLTRYKTLGKYLGNINNINAHFPKDVYVFHQKTAQNALMIEWELAPDFDAQGVMLPRRLVLRDQCQLRYRRWDAVNSVFIYDGTENRCPIINRGIITADPDFSTIAGWTLGTNWGWNGSTKVTKSGSNVASLAGTTRAIGGHNYAVRVTIADMSAGNLSVYFGGAAVISLASNDTHFFGAYCSATNAALTFTASSEFNGSVSAIELEYYADAQDNDTYLDGPQDDVCSHTLAGCRLRWPGVSLPFSGFPGVGRVRV